jgi:hypothetical protein
LTPDFAVRPFYDLVYVVTYLLKAKMAEPDEMVVARQWLCKHVSTATESRDCHNTNATMEELLEAVFSMQSASRLYTRDRNSQGVRSGIDKINWFGVTELEDCASSDWNPSDQ